MVDVLDVNEDFSAGVFFDKARQITAEILEVGTAFFYVQIGWN